MDSERAKRLFLTYIFPVTFLIAGGVIVFQNSRAYRLGAASDSWPASNGRIIASSVMTEIHRGRTRYHAAVKYKYSVDGDGFENDTIYAGYGSSQWPSSAEALVAKYPVGHSVSVHYSPNAPEQSVLQQGASGWTLFNIIAMLPLIAYGGACLCHLPSEFRGP